MSSSLLCSVSETARLLGMTETAIRCMLHRGKFPLKPIRIGYRVFFARSDIDGLVLHKLDNKVYAS